MKGCCKLVLWCVLSLLPATGARTDDLQSSIGAVCDSQDQAERLIRLAEENPGSPREALSKLNDEVGKADACVVAPVYYKAGSKVARIATRLGTFEVVEIHVVAVETAQGTAVLSAPVMWFAIFQAKDQDV
jgi:hypothetical protein